MCNTQAAAETLIQGAAEHDENPRLQATVGGSDWSTILVKKLYYHGSCYLDLVRPNRENGKNMPIDNCNKEKSLAEIEKRVLQNYEVLPATELTDIFCKISENYEHLQTRKTLVNLVCKNFQSCILSWTPNSGP